MKQLIFTKRILLITMLFSCLFNYSQINDTIGNLSIFAEPSKDELLLWMKFDTFLFETYNYVKREKIMLNNEINNPFKDSIFINKFKTVTYRTIYDSAKAYRDSIFYKNGDYKKYKNINQWAIEKFPLFTSFNKEFNKFLEETAK